MRGPRRAGIDRAVEIDPGVVYHRGMRLRPYTPADREACLAIFDSSCPKFVAQEERAMFERWLENPGGRYGVYVHADGTVIGCGGIFLEEDGRTVHLTWGLIDAAHHRQGHGRAMTLERLGWIAEMPDVDRIRMDTSQHTVGFYERLGFHTVSVRPDGYAPGLDRHDLELVVDAASRARLFAWQWSQAGARR